MSEGQIEPETITEADWNGAQAGEPEDQVAETTQATDQLKPEQIDPKDFATADRQIAAEEAEDNAGKLQPEVITDKGLMAAEAEIAAEEAADKAGQLQPEAIDPKEWSVDLQEELADPPEVDLPIIPAPTQPVSAEKPPESNIEQPRSGIRG